MAIQFLNNLNLNDNQLLNAKVQVASTAPTAAKGQIYLDSTTNVNTLKYHDGSQWIGLKQLNLNNSTFVSLANLSATGSNIISLEASLSATGTKDNTTFLRGDNTWAAPLQYAGWYLAGDLGTPSLISSGETASILGGAMITTTAVTGDGLVVAHLSTSRSDTTSTATPAFGGTFTAVDSVTSNATGHVTAINLKTVTIPASPTITLTGDVTGSGTTSIATTIAAGAVEFSMMDAAAVVTSGEGIANNNNDVTLPTSAAVKAYVDASTVGAIIFQGGYNAATNTPNLDSPPTGTIKKGFMWTVTADGTFFTEQLRVGDSLIAEVDSPTTLADWTTVQGNVDLATLTTVGIGNVNAGDGVGVAYSNGTATVTNTDKGSSQNIFKNIAVSGQSTVVAETNDDTLTLVAGNSIAITTNATTDTITIASTYTPPVTSGAIAVNTSNTYTYPNSITASAINNVMIQLVDTVTHETVYADVTRISTTSFAVSYAATPTNGVTALIQLIG